MSESNLTLCYFSDKLFLVNNICSPPRKVESLHQKTNGDSWSVKEKKKITKVSKVSVSGELKFSCVGNCVTSNPQNLRFDSKLFELEFELKCHQAFFKF